MKDFQSLLEVKELCKSYGTHKVIKFLSFKVKYGESVAIIGSNGSGKSTLCEILTGVKNFDSGNIYWNTKRISVCLSEYVWTRTLRVRDAVNFYQRIYSVNLFDRRTLMEKLSVRNILDKKLSSLSTGEKKRLDLFLSLIKEVDVLVGDEISLGLDIETKFKMLNYLKYLQKKNGLTLILVSHDWEEIKSLCQVVFFLHEGVVAKVIKVSDLVRRYNDSLLNFFKSFVKG